MSTSDAADLASGVEGREEVPSRSQEEHTVPQRPDTAGDTRTARQQDESLGPKLCENDCHGEESETDCPAELAASRGEREYTGRGAGANAARVRAVPGSGGPDLRRRAVAGSDSTSFLYFELSCGRKPGPDASGPGKEQQRRLHRFPEELRGQPGVRSLYVNGETPSPGEQAYGVSSLEKTYLVNKEEETLEKSNTNPDPSHQRQSHSLSNRGLGCHDCFGTATVLSGSRQPEFGSTVPTKDIKTDLARTQKRLGVSEPSADMLSSTMVSVLAPQWNGRLRRSKKDVVTVDPGQEAQRCLQEVTHGTNSDTCQSYMGTQMQYGWERGSRDIFQSSGRHTGGWSTLSGPPTVNVNCPIKRPVVQSISVYADSGRLDNRQVDGDVLNFAAKIEHPVSPHSLDLQPNMRLSQTSCQVKPLSPSRSKPTTSSLLLSLRKLNSNWRNSKLSPSHSEANPSPVTCSPNEEALMSRPLPSPNSNERERSKSLHDPSSTTYRAVGRAEPDLSPSSNDHRHISNLHFRSVLDRGKASESSPPPNLSQSTKKTYPTFSYPSKQTFLTHALSSPEKTNTDKTTNVTDASLPSPPPSQYDRFAFLKSQNIPRGTILRSTSWWKHVTQEGSNPLRHDSPSANNINNNNRGDSSTISVNPSNNNNVSQRTIDNSSFRNKISNRDNNNRFGCLPSANLNIYFTEKGTAKPLKQNSAQDCSEPHSDRFLRPQNDSNLNDREIHKPHSLPSAFFGTKISVAGQTSMSHTKEFSKPDASDRSYTGNDSETPLKSPNTPKASNSNHEIRHGRKTGDSTYQSCYSYRPYHNLSSFSLESESHVDPPSLISPSQKISERSVSNSAENPTSPVLYTPQSTTIPTTSSVTISQTTSVTTNSLQTEIKSNLTFTKPSLSLNRTHKLNSQVLSPKSVLSPHSIPQPETPTSPQLLSPINSNSCLSPGALSPKPQTPKTTTPDPTTAATSLQPLGFERTYIFVSKPSHPKTVSTLSSTSPHVYSKTDRAASTNSIPLSSSTTPSSSIAPLPTTTTPNSALLMSSVTAALACSTAITSSPLTPPATPTIVRAGSPVILPPEGERTFIGSLDLSPKKHSSKVEGKKPSKVTWMDTVGLQGSEPGSKSQESAPSQRSPEPTIRPLSPSRPRTPSIFSFLRPGCTTDAVSPLSPRASKASSTSGWNQKKNQPLSPGPADQTSKEGGRALAHGQQSVSHFTFDHGGMDFVTVESERKLSGEESAAPCQSAAPLSIPSDFGSRYNNRYSSPPYSVLKSTRTARVEAMTSTHTAALSQQSPSPPKIHCRLPENRTSPIASPSCSRESSNCVAMDTDHINNNNNNCKPSSRDGQMSLEDNGAGISTQPLLHQPDKAINSSPEFVKPDSVRAPESRIPKATVPHTANTKSTSEITFKRQTCSPQKIEVVDMSHRLTQQTSSRSEGNQRPSPEQADGDIRGKELEGCRSRYFGSESDSKMPPSPSPKRGLFALKKRESSGSMGRASVAPSQATQPSPEKTKSETDRAHRSSNKMDQVLKRLRQTFSGSRLDDDLMLPWRCKPSSQTPSISGLSDSSNNTTDSNKTLEEESEQGRVEVGWDGHTRNKDRGKSTENKYTLTQSSSVGNNPEKTATDKDKVCEVFRKDNSVYKKDQMSEIENQARLTSHSPTRHNFDFYGEKKAEHKPANICLPKDASPVRLQPWNPNHSAQHRASTASPRSPFSPFSSLSPFSPTDATDDSVFYSPKLQRQKRPISPSNSGERISPVCSGQIQMSTTPPSIVLCQEKDRLSSYSSCADLKYGLEAGRSFSVSSVLSSRPSGPGRISTGSRVLSVSDLSDPLLTFEEQSSRERGLHQWSSRSGQSMCETVDDYRAIGDCNVSSGHGDQGKIRSKSLPRSLTRSLSAWGSDVCAHSPPTTTTTTTKKPGQLWSLSNLGAAEGPPTPPPSPPWSPRSRRMSKPPSLSSPTTPSPPGLPQDNQSLKGHLPSRGYVASLTAFEESDSSDASSDTTTDDEYYLEEEGEDKETEL